MSETVAYAVTIDGKLYAMGATADSALLALGRFLAGAGKYARALRYNAVVIPLDADAASEAAECLDAPWA